MGTKIIRKELLFNNLYRTYNGEKYGITDENDNEIVPHKYDELDDYREGIIKFKFNSFYGFINHLGQKITNFKYQEVMPYTEGLAAVQLNDKWGFIDHSGKIVIPLQYDDVCCFNEGLAAVNKEIEIADELVQLHGLWGFIDTTGKVVIPLQYSKIENFYNGFAAVKKAGGVFTLDKDGYVEVGGNWGLINKSGNILTEFIYSHVYLLNNRLVWATETESSKNCLFTLKSNEIVPVYMDEIKEINEDFIIIKNEDKWALVDSSGHMLCDFIYDYIFYESNVFRVNTGGHPEYLISKEIVGGRWNLLDCCGNIINKKDYNQIYQVREGIAVVELNNKYGYINSSGEEIIPLIFDNLSRFSDGLAIIQTNNKYGFIDRSGHVVIPAKYDNAAPFSEGLARVAINRKWGFINKKGKLVIDFIYDSSAEIIVDQCFEDGAIWVSQNGERFFIDRDGNRLEQ